MFVGLGEGGEVPSGLGVTDHWEMLSMLVSTTLAPWESLCVWAVVTLLELVL